MTQAPDREPEEQRGPTIRDKRRIDPETYQVRDPGADGGTRREPQATATSAADASGAPPQQPDARDAELVQARIDVAERTADL